MPLVDRGPAASGGPSPNALLARRGGAVHTLLLLTAGAGEDLYRHRDAGGAPSGSLLVGSNVFGASQVTRIRRLDEGGQIRIHDNPDIDRLAEILLGRDVRVCIQTALATIVSGPYAGAGGNYANWPFGAVEAPVFAAIAEGERVLFALEEI